MLQDLPNELLFEPLIKLKKATLLELLQINNKQLAKVFQDQYFWRKKLKKDYDFSRLYNFGDNFVIWNSDSRLNEKVTLLFELVKAYSMQDAEDLISKTTFSQEDINNLLFKGAFKNIKNLVDFVIKKGANKFNTAMTLAAANGNIEMVKFLLDKGATNYEETAILAVAENRHKEIIQLMIDEAAKKNQKLNYVKIMINIALYGNKDTTNWMIELAEQLGRPFSLNDFNKALVSAIMKDNLEIVKLMIKKGANDLGSALIEAVVSNTLKAIKLIFELADEFGYQINLDKLNKALQISLNNQYEESTRLIQSYLTEK